jgi:hypothetical protein
MLVALFLAFAEPPKITISKETTYITGPLRADGVVDYVMYTNEALKKVKPEDNAAVALLKAFGPRLESNAEFYRLLQCEVPPREEQYLFDIDQIPALQGKRLTKELADALDRCVDAPWSADSHPHFVEWLKLNEIPLQVVNEASRLPQFVEPFMRSVWGPAEMYTCYSRFTNAMITARDLLRARAMLRLASKDVDGAIGDVECIYRLAFHRSSKPGQEVDRRYADDLFTMAFRADRQIAFHGGMSASRMRERAKRLQELRPERIVDIDMQTERLIVLSQVWETLRVGRTTFPDNEKIRTIYSPAALEEGLRAVNRAFDRFEDALKLAPPEREKTIASIENEFDEQHEKATEREETFFLWRKPLPAHPKGRDAAAAKLYAERVVSRGPAFGMLEPRRQLLIARHRQTMLAHLLMAWKREHGTYPDRLDAGMLGGAAEMFTDPATNKPFVYRIVNDKREVVGVGRDGVLDTPEARNKDDGDDYILELP